LAKSLGAHAELHLDVERIADRVVHRLRRDEPAGFAGWSNAGHVWRRHRVRILSTAAALVLISSSGFFLFNREHPESVNAALVVPMELDELTQDELTSVLDSLSVAAPVSESFASTLSDLSEAELQELLAMMEG
jgi:hypothetical protein